MEHKGSEGAGELMRTQDSDIVKATTMTSAAACSYYIDTTAM